MKAQTKTAILAFTKVKGDEVRMNLTCLLIVFITLKMAGLVNWSWVWVLAPFWIPAGFVLFLLAGWVLFYLAWYVAGHKP